jgi:hypothetical protein
MIVTRLLLTRLLVVVALVWSAFSVFNLYYFPLVLLQLSVIWISYFLLKPKETQVVSKGVSKPAVTIAPKASIAEKQNPNILPPLNRPSMFSNAGSTPSWINHGMLVQFKAAVMLSAIENYNLPVPFVAETVADDNFVKRILWVAAELERSGRSFDDQASQAALRVKMQWGKLSPQEKERFESDQNQLQNIY